MYLLTFVRSSCFTLFMIIPISGDCEVLWCLSIISCLCTNRLVFLEIFFTFTACWPWPSWELCVDRRSSKKLQACPGLCQSGLLRGRSFAPHLQVPESGVWDLTSNRAAFSAFPWCGSVCRGVVPGSGSPYSESVIPAPRCLAQRRKLTELWMQQDWTRSPSLALAGPLRALCLHYW